MNDSDLMNTINANKFPDIGRSFMNMISNSATGAAAQVQAVPRQPSRLSVRIFNCKNGYIIMPDNNLMSGGLPLFDECYVAKDLDEVKDALARYYVIEKLE